MDGIHTIVMFFLSYITDYPIISSPPTFGVQKQTLPPYNQMDWWRQQKQKIERAQMLWNEAERQKQREEPIQDKLSGSQRKPRTKMNPRLALRSDEPQKNQFDVTILAGFTWGTSEKTPITDPAQMIGFERPIIYTEKPRPQVTARLPPSINSPMDFSNNCDYVAYYCLKVWETGHLCARSIHRQYMNFTNYCEMQYVNCMERYELWIVAHPGYCYFVTSVWDFKHYPYLDDYFLDQHYRQPFDEAFQVVPMHYHDKPDVQWHP